MINKNIINGTLKYCIEDISSIENYQQAINDNENMWELHHKLETQDENGCIRKLPLSYKELQEMGLYWNRPANELIFMKQTEHKSYHLMGNSRAKGKNIGNQNAKGNILSKETRKQMGISRLGNINNGCTFIRCIETGEIHRTNEWAKLGFKNAYQVVYGRQKSCKGYHFEKIE